MLYYVSNEDHIAPCAQDSQPHLGDLHRFPAAHSRWGSAYWQYLMQKYKNNGKERKNRMKIMLILQNS